MKSTNKLFSVPSLMLLAACLLSLLSMSSLAQLANDPRSDVFSAEFPYASKFISVNGHRLHYVDEGNAAGDTFLFLHGNPTSSYLWRNVMRYIKPDHRIVAVDNIGFGKSDQPTWTIPFRPTMPTSKDSLRRQDCRTSYWSSMTGVQYWA